MIAESEGAAPRDESDPALAALTEQITQRLQSGEKIDADDYAQKYPAWAASIRSLLPTLHQLIELGRSLTDPNRSPRLSEDTNGRQPPPLP